MNFFEAEMDLREHHYFGDDIPLREGLDLLRIGDDPPNVWIPRGASRRETANVSLLCSPLQIPFVREPLPHFRVKSGVMAPHGIEL